MDIKDIQSGSPAALDPVRDTRAAAASTPSSGTPDQPGDSVTMSDQAQAFQQARHAALAVPEIRTDRVEAVRRQLATGELRPDSTRIAQALISQDILS
jgi:negative regulator of flagellin synthesis FlgM